MAPGITLPGSEDVTQVNVRRDPGVNTPAPVSSGLRELGSAISQVGQQFQVANDARVLSNLESDAATKLSDFQNELESDPDSFGEWEGKFKEFSKNHMEEVQKSGVNRTVYDAWSRSFTPMQERSRVKILARARETMVDKGLTELKTNLESVQGLAIKSNKNYRDIYFSQADLMIERAQDTGFIKDSTAQELRDKFRGGTDRARFENAVNVDPELAKEALDAGDFEVSEKERPEWNKYVDTAIKTARSQERIDADREKKAQEKAEKAMKEQTELDFIDRLDTLEPPTLHEINTSSLDANHKLQWRTVLEKEPKLNKELYADLTTAINGDGMYNGEPLDRDMITDHFRDGSLTKDAHNYLLGRWDKRHKPATEKDAAKENNVKLAVGVLANLKKNGMFDDDPTKNSIDHARAVDDLVKWATANPDGDPIKYAEDTLVPKVEAPWYEKVLSGVGAVLKPGKDTLKRNDAIDYLVRNNKPVTENNIQKAMGYLGGN